MKSLMRERFLRLSFPRIFYFGMMGAVLLVVPSFVLSGTFYAVVGYLLFVSVFGIVDRVRLKGRKSLFDYGTILVRAALFFCGVISLVFARYLVKISPLYLGALLILEGLYYIRLSFCGWEGWRRGVLTVLSVLVLSGGMCVVIFTFGFGFRGLVGLAAVSGIASGLSCVYALLYELFYKGSVKGRK